MLTPFVYRATVLRTVDADNLAVDLDLGRGMHDLGENGKGLPLRLAGCNGRELDQPGGAEAAAHLARLLPLGTRLVVATIKPDKYGGRWQARVQSEHGVDLVEYLIGLEWLAPWDGRGPRPLPPWPRSVGAPGGAMP